MDAKAKFRATWRLAGALPDARRKQVRTRLAQLAKASRERAQSVGWDGGLLDGVKVIRPGEPGYEEAKANARPPVDVDLAVANELDKMYGAVKEEVVAVANAAGEVAQKAADVVSTPLIAAAVVLALVFAMKKR